MAFGALGTVGEDIAAGLFLAVIVLAGLFYLRPNPLIAIAVVVEQIAEIGIKVLYVGLLVGVSLGVLYLLVRFVKWAWTD